MTPGGGQTTVAAALASARRAGLARLDARWLLAELLGKPASWLMAHDDHLLSPALVSAFEDGCRRRAGGEPLAYVLGRWSFCALALEVTPAVLIPRPETEALVAWALSLRGHWPEGADVADLGTGSGAIVLALAKAWPQARCTGVDRSAAALEVARRNAARLGLAAVVFAEGDWWAALPGRRFDLVLANPPYVAEGDPHLAALGHEPLSALTAGPTGLDDLQRITAGAAAHLRSGGWLLLEHGHDQGEAVRALLQDAGLVDAQTRADLAGLDRLSGARKG